MTVIAFVGSVFSSYYAWAQSRHSRGGREAEADNHCCINVALYGRGSRRWTMTERGRRHVQRSVREFIVGPSRLQWEGDTLRIDLHEVGVPIPQRVDGTLRIKPRALSMFHAPLDDAGRHRWGPIAPCSRIEVDLQRPGLRWQGDAYLDSNEGDEPIERPFTEWDWSRASLRDGSTAVIYDVRQKNGAARVITQRFQPDGSSVAFDAPRRHALPRSAWRIERHLRSEGDEPPRVLQTLEDTPFYTRSLLESGLCGQRVTSVHETLDVSRLVSLPVRLMLPWRMPRRG
ncbi:MAG: carotenoid 1,2-hydratase [Chitinophagaceae bacterium]|nr:carotenoid 1,2-hydratase [Rubrivivax sp.]